MEKLGVNLLPRLPGHTQSGACRLMAVRLGQASRVENGHQHSFSTVAVAVGPERLHTATRITQARLAVQVRSCSPVIHQQACIATGKRRVQAAGSQSLYQACQGDRYAPQAAAVAAQGNIHSIKLHGWTHREIGEATLLASRPGLECFPASNRRSWVMRDTNEVSLHLSSLPHDKPVAIPRHDHATIRTECCKPAMAVTCNHVSRHDMLQNLRSQPALTPLLPTTMVPTANSSGITLPSITSSRKQGHVRRVEPGGHAARLNMSLGP